MDSFPRAKLLLKHPRLKDHDGRAREKHSARQAGDLPPIADSKKRAEEALAAAERDTVKTEAADAVKAVEKDSEKISRSIVLHKEKTAAEAAKSEGKVGNLPVDQKSELNLSNERKDEKVMEEVIKVDKRKIKYLEMVLNWRLPKKSPPKMRAQKSPPRMRQQKSTRMKKMQSLVLSKSKVLQSTVWNLVMLLPKL